MRILRVVAVGVAMASFILAADDVNESFYKAIRNDNMTALKSLTGEGANLNTKDRRGTTPLMYAAAFGSLESMKLLLDRGADVNAGNAFDMTPLMWAAHDTEKVRLLLAHGARVNARSKQGRAALLIASMEDGNSETVRLLLDKGAVVDQRDERQTTPLIEAVDRETAKLLIGKGADVNAKNDIGFTPLINAVAYGDVEWAKMLIRKGANVNATSADQAAGTVKNGPIDLGFFTPLNTAAAYGPAELVEVLLDAGAKVNTKDCRGMTPLMFAIASDHNDPRVVKLLLQHGADVHIKSNAGEDAVDWARKFQHPEVLAHLGADRTTSTTKVELADFEKRDLTAAVRTSIGLLQRNSANFLQTGGCASCHAQSMTLLAVEAARAKGVPVDENAAITDTKVIALGFAGFEQPMLQRIDPPGTFDTVMFMLLGLSAGHHPADHLTDTMVGNIAVQQRAAGNWDLGGIARPPIQDGGFTRTAVAIRVLQAYGMTGRKAELDQRIARAAKWLRDATPRTTEDMVMRMLGLKWTNADTVVLSNATEALVALQRADGGWAQTPDLESDAYATGQALYALQASGMTARDPVYQKGVAWLLKTQRPDGSWHVASRSPKFQPYFQSGFPHDHDQWISASATAWAVLGLTGAIEPKQVAAK